MSSEYPRKEYGVSGIPAKYDADRCAYEVWDGEFWTSLSSHQCLMDKPDDNGRTICDLCGVVLQPWSGPDSCQMPHPGCPMFGIGYDEPYELEGIAYE